MLHRDLGPAIEKITAALSVLGDILNRSISETDLKAAVTNIEALEKELENHYSWTERFGYSIVKKSKKRARGKTEAADNRSVVVRK